MKVIRTEDAVGHVLCHDLTRIIRGEVKDTPYRKGQVIEEKDIEILLSMGKDHLYVWEVTENVIHENDAALQIAELILTENMALTEVKEGKVEIISQRDGFFQVDVNKLNEINRLGEVAVVTRLSGFSVESGDRIAAVKIIPLLLDKSKMTQVQKILGTDHSLLSLSIFEPQSAGIITTGNEVFLGRIVDTFTPVVEEKLKNFNIKVVAHTLCDDNIEHIKNAAKEMIASGVDMIFCTGGMSVDPDDLTPGAIRALGAQVEVYGAPILPGSMFLMSYLNGIPIVGLPGCVMYDPATIFDVVLPKLAAKKPVLREDIARLGHGGLCLRCKVCHFPNCTYGKAI